MRTGKQGRKYANYRDDPDIKVPVIRWLMDKWVVYATFAMAAVVIVAVTTAQGNASYRAITATPKKNSPYQDIQSVESPGMKWAKALVSENPASLTDWTPGTASTPQHPFTSDTCKQDEVPSTVLAAYDSKGGGVTVIAQVYGAGQATKQFNTYKDGAWNKCFNNMEQVSDAADKGVDAYKFDGGFAITAGDAIVGVRVGDTSTRDSLLKHYLNRIQTTLTESGCVSLASHSEDASRSFFYDPKSYTGFKQTQIIHTKVDISGNSTPLPQKLKSVADPEAEEPEAPLPQGFPELPKEAPKPTLPDEVTTVDDFTSQATYPIKDTSGPGCGWAWSSQKQPVYDEKSLQDTKDKTISSAQSDADQKALDYMKNKHYYSGSMVTYMQQADTWNQYVTQVDAVHEKWTWLTTQRSLIETSWRNYVTEHNSWFTFDDRKQAAKTKYDQESLTCNTANEELKKWEQKYGEAWKKKQEEAAKKGISITPTPAPTATSTPTPTPTASPSSDEVPPPPAGCSTPPERPEILDQSKPAEPQPPTIPDGVTIPNSWPQPNK